MRAQPYPQRLRLDTRSTENHEIGTHDQPSSASASTAPLQSDFTDTPVSARSTFTTVDQRAPTVDSNLPEQLQHQPPVITDAIRARISAALMTLRGKRGAPFSFVTSGDGPSCSTRGPSNPTSHNAQRHQPFEQPQMTPPSIKLSSLLQPLKIGARHETSDGERSPSSVVKMPSYLSSMTLGQTITDPIEGGIISPQASIALFEHFMLQMNAKWEYILDPYFDTHDDVQRRSSLLFASVLFCSSKFANYNDSRLVSKPDSFLQTRLCSLSRNLVIKSLAQGDRSIETMQALYLLACWKDADDDTSYLHSGYAFSILRDMDLESSGTDGGQIARRRRIWVALFRQDRQQSLFFVRRASFNQGCEDIAPMCDVDTWLKIPYALPSDFIACCSADLRRIQVKLHMLVQKASSTLLPCLLDLMDAELSAWRSKWNPILETGGRTYARDDQSSRPELIDPGTSHLVTLAGLWENSVRLNISSAILRQALAASVMLSPSSDSQQDPPSWKVDFTTIQQFLAPNLPGLSSSIQGAFDTLHHLISFPNDDLRRAPDAILLLAPSAALFLCLILCLRGKGILGPAFQNAAVSLIRETAQHIEQCVKSPQDTLALYSAYLGSLVELLDSSTPHCSTCVQDIRLNSTVDRPHTHGVGNGLDINAPTLEVPEALADEIGAHPHHYSKTQSDSMPSPSGNLGEDFHIQSIVNLLDSELFWEMLPERTDIGF